MTPQEAKELVNGIRESLNYYTTGEPRQRGVHDNEIHHYPGFTFGDVILLLDLVPPGLDVQIDSAEEQRIVDEQRRKQAEKIIGQPKSIEEATQLAINWCVTAMQETCNADYWKERTKVSEQLGLHASKTKDGSVHITAPPGGLVIEGGITIRGADATAEIIEGEDDE